MSGSPGFVKREIYRSLLSFLCLRVSPVVFLALSGLTSLAQASSPVLSLSAPGSAYINEVVLIDARASTGISKLPQLNGTPSVTIDFGDGFSANLLASGHAYRLPGTYTITVTAKDSGGAVATTQKSIVVSDIPVASGTGVQVLTD